nr:hypothetical protein [uncultured Sphaerochaeta sp.]
MDFTIDVVNGKRPFKNFWNGSGFSPGSLLLNADMQQQMAYAGSIPFHGIRYIRIHYLLDLVKIMHIDSDKPLYQWDVLDKCIDVLIENNLLPFFELMGNPEGYFTDFTDNVQVMKWRDFIFHLVQHFIDRYGISCVLQWYFETWNEPDGSWWKQSEEAFCNYYDACSEGLSMVHTDLKFGGPGTCMGLSSIFKSILAHCDTGVNYFTKMQGTRLDFISIHEKGIQACVEDINPNSLKIVEKEQLLYNYVVANHPRFKRIPFINNECDPQVGWWDTHTWRAKSYHAAIAVKIIHQHIEAFHDRGVSYPLLSNDNGFVGGWGRRTMMARFGLEEDQKAQNEYKISADEFEEDKKRRTFAMIKKPILSVMTMLSLLGNERCSIESSSSFSQPNIGVIATMKHDQQLAVLVYHSNDEIMSSGNEPVNIKILGIPFSEGILTEYRVEQGFTDPFSLWEAEGFPQVPDVSLLERMRDEAELQAIGKGQQLSISHGELTIETIIPIPSVRLFLFTKQNKEKPPMVEQPITKIFSGLDLEYEDVLIKWPSIDLHSLQTYEVLYRKESSSDFERINKVDTQCALWLHTRKKGEVGEYRVRAVDFWGNCGDTSISARGFNG